MKLKLDLQDLRVLRDFVQYLDVDIESITNLIQQLILRTGDTSPKAFIEPFVIDFLNNREYINLKDLSKFIESINFPTTDEYLKKHE